MKESIKILGILAFVSILFFQGVEPRSTAPSEHQLLVADSTLVVYPETVKGVIDAKCYECHSANSKSQKAKDKLMWDDLPGMETAAQVKKLDDILEVLEEGKMPPKRAVEMKPEMKLTDKEAGELYGWAETISAQLMK